MNEYQAHKRQRAEGITSKVGRLQDLDSDELHGGTLYYPQIVQLMREGYVLSMRPGTWSEGPWIKKREGCGEDGMARVCWHTMRALVNRGFIVQQGTGPFRYWLLTEKGKGL